MKLFATCDAGLETTLGMELRALGFDCVTEGSRGVSFEGDRDDIWRANLTSRVANRVLLPFPPFPAPDRQALYRGVVEQDWTEWVDFGRTIAVDARTVRSKLAHSAFVGQVVKDALCDQLRRSRGVRPDVDRKAPDIPIAIRIIDDTAIVSLDSSGTRLHRRGYRTQGGHAPLRETLAAGILMLAQYDGQKPLLDPMSGSGTLVIEAALLASGTAPGAVRTRLGIGYAFEKWPAHDKRRFAQCLAAVTSKTRGQTPPPIVGRDIDRGLLRAAQANASRAGVSHHTTWETEDVGRGGPVGQAGVVVVNPPYGERLGDKKTLARLYQTMGDVLKRRFGGHHAWVLAGDPWLAKKIGLRPKRRHVLHNGPIECRLLEFELYAGSRKKSKTVDPHDESATEA